MKYSCRVKYGSRSSQEALDTVNTDQHWQLLFFFSAPAMFFFCGHAPAHCWGERAEGVSSHDRMAAQKAEMNEQTWTDDVRELKQVESLGD